MGEGLNLNEQNDVDERFHKDCTALSLYNFDIDLIKHHLDKVNSDIAIAKVIHTILANLKQAEYFVSTSSGSTRTHETLLGLSRDLTTL